MEICRCDMPRAGVRVTGRRRWQATHPHSHRRPAETAPGRPVFGVRSYGASRYTVPAMNTAPLSAIPTRTLGRTGYAATLFALGGEGILRTHGNSARAARVIERALDRGVNYCDTAPAYASSMDYYGAALGERRKQIFLASKTADRTRDGSLRILDDSLKRLRTDRLDLWQLHDLRTVSEVEQIFSKHGAIHALMQAREHGRVRFLGLTGHHDPAVLIEAMRRFDFDTVLIALNIADVHRISFARSVLP